MSDCVMTPLDSSRQDSSSLISKPGEPGIDAFIKSVQLRLDQNLRVLFKRLPNVAPRLVEAMAYACLGEGKRIRPALVYAACQVFGGDQVAADRAAMAVEILHAYSLVHDDLPAMDDDDLRRGQPTCHVAFDEATAILAGDALQSLAFEVLVDSALGDAPLIAAQQVSLVRVLAQAGGTAGMAAGQSLDLDIAGSDNRGAHSENSLAKVLAEVHFHKTACLIRASLEMGALVAGVASDSAEMTAIKTYGESIGLAFQIQDDILDATSSTAVLGKQVGADEQQEKLTYPAVLGLDRSQREMQRWSQRACEALAELAPAYSVGILQNMSSFLMRRSF